MGSRVRGPNQGRAEADRQDPVGPQRARDASASGQARGGAQAEEEGGKSGGWRNEKIREPVRIQLDEHDQESAGKEVPRFRRRQTGAGQAGRKENVEEQIARSPRAGATKLTVSQPRGGGRFRTVRRRRRPRR